ncbi:hypothetical protein BBJ28_00026418 [Nothophytophthora sp. Chile5]|nr:hypothetical protein BBJ28_00026418 [Nothophytophthora sp. Chile5]
MELNLQPRPAANGAVTAPSSDRASPQTSFQPAALPMTTSEYLQRSLTPGEAAEWGRTNPLADRNTIVDMSLRLARFVACVVVALAAAFTFALVTSKQMNLAHVTTEDAEAAGQSLADRTSDVVETYNTLFGYVMFTGGKIFEVFCETLIFPTLSTYLHNCSLYPGDQPARVHSHVKARSIFWGLKTVIILMNVGFTSIYVGQNTMDPTAVTTTRRLATSDEFTDLLLSLEVPWAADSEADVLHTILRTAVTGVATPFEFQDACSWREEDGEQQWGVSADDVDTSSVSFGFRSHSWNAKLLASHTKTLTKMTEIPLQQYLRSPEKYAEHEDWDFAELYATFQRGLTAALAATTSGDVVPTSLDTLVRAVSSELKATLPEKSQMGGLVLRLEHVEVTEDVRFTSLTLTVPMEATGKGTTLCEAAGCIYATSRSIQEQLHIQPGLSIAGYEHEEDAALVFSVGSRFEVASGAPSLPHEMLSLSFGKLSWEFSPLHVRHEATCDDGSDGHCLGLSLPFATGDGVLLVGKDALATDHTLHSMSLATLRLATIPDMTRPGDEALTTWHRLVASDGQLVPPASSECTPLVDAYLAHIESNHFYLDDPPTEAMYSAALFYLLQRGVPTSYADAATSRRRLALSAAMASSGSGSGASNATMDIEIAVPIASAMVTVAGCVGIILLMLCVIYLPTDRVKLSPDTTPAAQYVQILTDDLYPDVVHKKRLRFANGDCLLFNEYVVDAIVLHAKRDQTKKIYL